MDLGLRGRLTGVLLAFAMIVTLGGRAASGAEVGARLSYDVPPGCPTTADFRSLVAKRLGYDPFEDDAPEQVIIQIERSGIGLEGRLEWLSAAGSSIGEHTFPSRSGDCGELVRAMGFSLALQMQLMAVAKADTPPVAPTPTPPPATVAPPAPEHANVPPAIAIFRSEPSVASFAAGVGAAVGIGLSPSTVGVGRLFGSVAWSHLGLELAGELSSPSTTHRSDGAGFSQYEALASLAGCGLGGAFSACLLVKVGEIRVAGEGLPFPETSSALLVQTGLRLGLTHPFGSRAYIVGRGEGVATLTRGIVTVDAMPVWTTPRVAALFGVDVGIRFR